ncbi:hypothetical protein R3Q06_25515 [Rhodococcus erythropolis]|uniref:hypothetical protein n=1 Tax=Rhodococcus erythropolis TaxID=1833 RepID=UPI00294944C0|nr:hypothetical protein [Rhodococcus erythropolis]MDV6276858.1 hypothetical protein [Rhodococcus erythropolis]
MTEDRTSRTRRRASLRKLLYIPLAVGVLAGAISVGTGIGSTAPTAAPDAGGTASTSASDGPTAFAGDPHWWSLYNDSGLPIYGEWSLQTGPKVIKLDIAKDLPLPFGSHESRPRIDDSGWSRSPRADWTAHICFNHAWWSFDRTERNRTAIEFGGNDATFVLRGDNGVLKATWQPSDYRAPSEASLDLDPGAGPC